MRPGIPERHQRYPKSAKFSGHYVPWAGALGGPRLPKAHSRRHRIHFTKAFAQGLLSGKALGGLGRHGSAVGGALVMLAGASSVLRAEMAAGVRAAAIATTSWCCSASRWTALSSRQADLD
mgnify:CR=1 FL=1